MRKSNKSSRRNLIIIVGVVLVAAAIVIPVFLTSNTKMIVEGPVYASTIDPVEPRRGEADVVCTLEEEMQKYGYDDAYFHVEVCLYFDISDRFTYKGKTMDEWKADPILDLHDEVREVWTTEIYEPMDREMVAAEQRGEEYALGWEKHDPHELFRNYFYETQPEDVIDAYEKAMELYMEADQEYSGWQYSDEPVAISNEIVRTEIDRLVELGIDLEVIYNNNYSYPVVYPEGYLTRRQIEEFPASDEFGYMIMWADQKDMDMND